MGSDLPGEFDVETPEVDQLAGRVDLGLIGGLRLTQHRRGGQLLPPRAGQQVGGPQDDSGPFVERCRRPRIFGGHGRFHRRGGVGVIGVGQRAEHGAVVVRLHDIDALSGPHDMAAADDVR